MTLNSNIVNKAFLVLLSSQLSVQTTILTRYQQYTYANIENSHLTFHHGYLPMLRSIPMDMVDMCAAYCTQYEACRFFTCHVDNEQDLSCTLLSYGETVGQSWPYDFDDSVMFWGKIDDCLLRTCYEAVQQQVTWWNARDYCAGNGGRLVEVTSAIKYALISNLISSEFTYHFIWLGASDIAREGEWTWTTSGSSVDVQFWANSEPNNMLRNEHCMAHYRLNDMWYDFRCQQELAFVCEYQQ